MLQKSIWGICIGIWFTKTMIQLSMKKINKWWCNIINHIFTSVKKPKKLEARHTWARLLLIYPLFLTTLYTFYTIYIVECTLLFPFLNSRCCLILELLQYMAFCSSANSTIMNSICLVLHLKLNVLKGILLSNKNRTIHHSLESTLSSNSSKKQQTVDEAILDLQTQFV